MIKREIVLPANISMSRQRAAAIVQAALPFQSGIMLQEGERIVNAKSTLGLLTVPAGIKLTLIAEGTDEVAAADKVSELLMTEGIRED